VAFFWRLFVIKGDFAIIADTFLTVLMGRGDKKSKKGKRSKGSFGVSRSKNAIKARLKRTTSKKTTATAAADEKPKRTAKKKAE